MKKKRLSEQVRSKNRKAQVTVFIILGILLLFGFLFVMWAFGNMQKGQLNQAQETFLLNAFKKEGMRIYVEDCLQDGLEEGLILLGKQGRIWNDQPGGSKSFNEKTGVVFDGERVYYGISNKEYFNYPNAYPCASNTNQTPHFCQYTHPNIQVGFGELNLRKSTLEQDLKAYLINRTLLCVENFTRNNISKSAKIESQDLQLGLSVENEGISVTAEYPLKFRIGQDEYFELTTFDFFYPSKFKLLLDAAVAYPLERDYRYLDFNYTQEYLENPSFTAYDAYKTLGINMSRIKLSNGDDVFTFTPNPYTILNSPIDYYFRLARQNRPPALDYVQRYSCPSAGYDYLVIPSDPELGNINISLYANDPDEDKFNYSIDLSDGYWFSVLNNGNSVWGGSSCAIGKINYSLWVMDVPPPKLGVLYYSVSGCGVKYFSYVTRTVPVKVTDEHGLSDWQDVRILVDRPISTNLSIVPIYSDVPAKLGDTYFASVEDPLFINISYPAESIAKFSAKVNLNYTNTENSEGFFFSFATNVDTTKKCISLPWNSENNKCNLSDYGSSDYLTKKSSFFLGDYAHLNSASDNGNLNLTFSIEYCGGNLNKSSSNSARIIVKECLPHRNPVHPFSFPYEKYTYQNYDFSLQRGIFVNYNTPINPLEATHSCCLGEPDENKHGGWRVAEKEENVTCFNNPQLNCYSGTDLGKKAPNLVLETQVRYCDGNSGNTCEGEFGYGLFNHTLTCGNTSYSNCGQVDSHCRGKPAFSFINENGVRGWCHGNLGCSKFDLVTVNNPIVYRGKTTFFSPEFIINQFLSSGNVQDLTGKSNFGFHYGCVPLDVNFNNLNDISKNSVCDANADGHFLGRCVADQSSDTVKCIGDV